MVRGVVKDPSAAAIANAEVFFLNDLQETATHTNSDGNYIARLSPGIYTIRIKSPGFYEERRGAFFARAGSEIKFDFILRAGGNPDAHETGAGERNYEWEELTAPAGDGLKPMVLYGKREQEGLSVRYSSLVFSGKQYPVVYTYDLLTVKASSLSYSMPDHSIVGTGSVVWEDGETSKLGSRIEVSFPEGKPQVNLTN